MEELNDPLFQLAVICLSIGAVLLFIWIVAGIITWIGDKFDRR